MKVYADLVGAAMEEGPRLPQEVWQQWSSRVLGVSFGRKAVTDSAGGGMRDSFRVVLYMLV